MGHQSADPSIEKTIREVPCSGGIGKTSFGWKWVTPPPQIHHKMVPTTAAQERNRDEILPLDPMRRTSSNQRDSQPQEKRLLSRTYPKG